jgi:hypothetical protein
MNEFVKLNKSDFPPPSGCYYIFNKIDRYWIRRKIYEVIELAGKKRGDNNPAVFVEICILIICAMQNADKNGLSFHPEVIKSAIAIWEEYTPRMDRRLSNTEASFDDVKDLAKDVSSGTIPGLSQEQLYEILRKEILLSSDRVTLYPLEELELIPGSTSLEDAKSRPFFTAFADMGMDLKLHT